MLNTENVASVTKLPLFSDEKLENKAGREVIR